MTSATHFTEQDIICNDSSVQEILFYLGVLQYKWDGQILLSNKFYTLATRPSPLNCWLWNLWLKLQTQ